MARIIAHLLPTEYGGFVALLREDVAFPNYYQEWGQIRALEFKGQKVKPFTVRLTDFTVWCRSTGRTTPLAADLDLYAEYAAPKMPDARDHSGQLLLVARLGSDRSS